MMAAITSRPASTESPPYPALRDQCSRVLHATSSCVFLCSPTIFYICTWEDYGLMIIITRRSTPWGSVAGGDIGEGRGAGRAEKPDPRLTAPCGRGPVIRTRARDTPRAARRHSTSITGRRRHAGTGAQTAHAPVRTSTRFRDLTERLCSRTSPSWRAQVWRTGSNNGPRSDAK